MEDIEGRFSGMNFEGRFSQRELLVCCSSWYVKSGVERRVSLLSKRDEGGVRSFDDLAMGLETGAISRGKAIKMTGAALAASALGLFASQGAGAQEVDTAASARRRCLRKGGDFCSAKGHRICCGPGGRRRRACCGSKGAACCSPGQRCNKGRCRHHS